jgi:ABC-type phosphate/phosphonate transport system substrate-binding protein
MITYLAPGFPVSMFAAMARLVDAELIVADEKSGPAGGDDPLTDGRADLAWLCSTSYVQLAARPGSAVRLAGVAWAPTDAVTAGRPAYFADVVVGAASSVSGLADLAGRRIGCNDDMSLSGYHALRIGVTAQQLVGGLDEVARWARLVMTGSHARSLERLLRGDLDAAVLDSVLLAAWRRQRPELGGLRIVERLGPWPTQPLVAAERLGPDAIATVRASLLAGNDDAALREELERMGLLGLVPVGPDHCAGVAAALARGPARRVAQPGVTQSWPK